MLPDAANFFITLKTARSKRRVARLFRPPVWAVRKCSWTDYEVRSNFAELVIVLEPPILIYGPVAQIEVNADQILAPLEAAGISYQAEYHSPDGRLTRERSWPGI